MFCMQSSIQLGGGGFGQNEELQQLYLRLATLYLHTYNVTGVEIHKCDIYSSKFLLITKVWSIIRGATLYILSPLILHVNCFIP